MIGFDEQLNPIDPASIADDIQSTLDLFAQPFDEVAAVMGTRSQKQLNQRLNALLCIARSLLLDDVDRSPAKKAVWLRDHLEQCFPDTLRADPVNWPILLASACAVCKVAKSRALWQADSPTEGRNTLMLAATSRNLANPPRAQGPLELLIRRAVLDAQHLTQPSRGSIDFSIAWFEAMSRHASRACQLDLGYPAVSVSNDKDFAFEWWSNERSLSVYLKDGFVPFALKSGGAELSGDTIEIEVTNEESFGRLWDWLNGERGRP